MNDEFESVWKEVVVAYPRYCPAIFLDGLSEV
jgi:hypothetical protein